MRLAQSLPLALLLLSSASCFAQDDVADVVSEKRHVGGDRRKSYFLIAPAAKEAPSRGYGLLVILPGGDGSEGFHPFVKRIRKHAVPEGLVVAQPIAFKWSQEQRIVWPTEKPKVPKQGFSTEEFVDAVIKDVKAAYRIDAGRVYCMGWSSGGPAAYAATLRQKTPLRGCYVLMSVYKPQSLPPAKNAKGRSIYIEHSQEDRVCPFWMARKAQQDFAREGVRTRLETYEGGHGWRGNLYGRIKKALQWLEEGPAREGSRRP